MNAIDTRLWNLQDMLRKLGFEQEAPRAWERDYREDWYIKPVNGGTQNVRVVLHPDDGNRVEAHFLDRHFVAEWSAAFSSGTPHSAIRATLRAMISA